jgi:hypothetical protein
MDTQANPYLPPRAGQPPVAASFFVVSAIGMLIATGLSYSVGVLHSFVAQWVYLLNGNPPQSMFTTFATSIFHNLVAQGINVISAGAGGYWVARHSRERPVSSAAVAGALMLLPLSLVVFVPYQLPQPLWSTYLFFLTPVPCAVLGGVYSAMRD